MKKAICVLGCVIALMLAGCQMRFVPPNPETSPSQKIENSTPNPDGASESDPVITDAAPNQSDDYNNPDTDNPSEDDLTDAPALPGEIHGNADQIEHILSDDVTIVERTGERELKNEGSLRGEIEVTHKLPVGNMELSEGDTVLFHIETKSADSELKITLTGVQTGTTLEGSVTGTGDISFEIKTADEYTVTLENCSLRGVQFTIDYSIGGSK